MLFKLLFKLVLSGICIGKDHDARGFSIESMHGVYFSSVISFFEVGVDVFHDIVVSGNTQNPCRLIKGHHVVIFIKDLYPFLHVKFSFTKSDFLPRLDYILGISGHFLADSDPLVFKP